MQIATIIKNGECQPNLFARYNPTGIPKTWLEANDICTKPMTRPLTSILKISVMMAKLIELKTPPKMPVIMRAISKS